jgi:hypothetical protein
VLDAAKKLRLAYLEEDEDRIILKSIMYINLVTCCRCWMPQIS